MLRTRFANIEHKWFFDLPWHMVDLKDWFYMVNVGDLDPVYYLHVRIAGIRSLWVINIPNPRNLTLHEAENGGAQVDLQSQDENDRPKACHPNNHAIWKAAPEPCTYCPDCGERLST